MSTGYVFDTSKIDAIEQEIGVAKVQINKLQKKIRLEIDSLIAGTSSLSDDEFWALMDELIETVSRRKQNYELAIENFLWDYFFGRKVNPYLMMRFVRTYAEKAGALHQPLSEVITGFGDDGYGDVIDSFPLFGRERYEKALKGQIEGTSEEQTQGENYIASTLNDKYIEKFCIMCEYNLPERERK